MPPRILLQFGCDYDSRALAFIPISAYFRAPIFGAPLNFEIELLLPELLSFPIAVVAIAILRFRLLEVDLIVNRTVVYGTLTAILAGAVAAGTLLSRNVFVAMTGETSDAAIVILTLLVSSAFIPLKSGVQSFFDRQFKQLPSSTGELRSFGEQLRAFIDLNDPEQVARRLIEQACRGLQAESGCLSIYRNGLLQRLQQGGPWRGKIAAALTLYCDGEAIGLLALSPRKSGLPYTGSELADLQLVGNRVACVLRIAENRKSLA